MNTSLAFQEIDDNTRVSSAIIHYEHDGYYQYETWIFRNVGRSTQIIHGSVSDYAKSERLRKITLKVHGYIVENLYKGEQQDKAEIHSHTTN